MGGLVLYEEDFVFMNTFTGHNTFIILFPTRPRAFFLALICSGCDGLGWVDPRVYRAVKGSALRSSPCRQRSVSLTGIDRDAFSSPMGRPSGQYLSDLRYVDGSARFGEQQKGREQQEQPFEWG